MRHGTARKQPYEEGLTEMAGPAGIAALRRRVKRVFAMRGKIHEDARAKEIHYDADVAAVIETIPKMYASVSVFLIIGLEGLQNSQLDSRGIPVLLQVWQEMLSEDSVFALPTLEWLLPTRDSSLKCERGKENQPPVTIVLSTCVQATARTHAPICFLS